MDLGIGSGTIPDNEMTASQSKVQTHQPRMVALTTHQDHHGVQEQVTPTHIYRLIYRHFISSALCLLKGILKEISG